MADKCVACGQAIERSGLYDNHHCSPKFERIMQGVQRRNEVINPKLPFSQRLRLGFALIRANESD